MGRPYKNELRSLPDTYQWAVSQDHTSIQRLVSDQRGKTLLAIGSGGSYSTAVTAAALHRFFHASPAYAQTPLELQAAPMGECGCSIWLFSGSGRNIDIRRALKASLPAEGNQITIFCGKAGSPIELDAREAFVDRIFSFSSGLGKDGYLATNSLFASVTFLAAAFRALPPSLSAVVESAEGDTAANHALRGQLLKVAPGKKNVIILHGPSGKAGALDLESKFTEGAIIASSVADYRNFAHGRHNWINRFGADSVVVAFVGPQERTIAQQTLALLPGGLPYVPVPLGDDFALAQILSVYYSINIAGWLSELHELDPGRPKIPEFGKKLYHLRAGVVGSSTPRKRLNQIIARKVAALGIEAGEADESIDWRGHCKKFCERLQKRTIAAVVFDYDGTLVRTDARFQPPCSRISRVLVQALEAGLAIGIATGRGDSVCTALRGVVPKDLQARVIVGYNNASQVAPLDLDCVVDGDIAEPSLIQCHEYLRRSSLSSAIEIRSYPLQLSIRPRRSANVSTLWTEIHTRVASAWANDLRVLVSGHSVDVIPKHVSKENLVAAVADTFAIENESILRIGDSGRWPGNDFELLNDSMGLSVGDVSADPATCWNLLPARCRGVDGTQYYLDRLLAANGSWHLQL